MKKRFVCIFIAIMILLTSAIFIQASAEEQNYLVISPSKATDICIGWSNSKADWVRGVFIGYTAADVEYDLQEQAVKFVGGGAAETPGNMYIQFFAEHDGTYNVGKKEYPYMVFCFKVVNSHGELYVHEGEAGKGSDKEDFIGDTDGYVKLIDETPKYAINYDFGVNINFKVVDYEMGVKDTVVWVKYIAFFKTKEDANGFDYAEWEKDPAGYVIVPKEIEEPEESGETSEGESSEISEGPGETSENIGETSEAPGEKSAAEGKSKFRPATIINIASVVLIIAGSVLFITADKKKKSK